MIVEVRNIVKRYGESIAVDHVNLSIKEGAIFGLLGPNGAGKSTMINMMIGLARIDGGEIKILGKDIKKHEMFVKSHIGIVPQDIAIFEDLTAEENVTFFGKLYGLKGSSLKQGVEEALAFVGLWDRRKQFSKNYSGGMKRRLNIACAIAHKPKLIIMDEPTVGIDPQSRNLILQSVKALNQMGSTVIYTSHYMEEVEEICTDVTIMDHGKIIAQGTKEELKELISSEEKITVEISTISHTVGENIKKIDGVRECTLRDQYLEVISQKNSKNTGEIIDAVLESGSKVQSFNVESPTLEDVFLTLTGRSLRD
ncbi:ABC transporter related [Alkaliphilus metalliredigens QYMF]|uniref:ABC transporter related n=1 Tax=Alkaliphilus metalliredigens (strain QYMF) TaxID=293826 RepID=A6TVR8_ALKMQ|nr:ABC transporter ATP-binding protein [Alkaliphilus metalliredigens]ABR50286.1 ABC transporter related [Alkaliphilus metalliredigens QYMF]